MCIFSYILPAFELSLEQQGALILRLMTQFARDFVSSIEGTKVDISTKELSGGARIYYIFHDVFGRALASIDATGNLDDQDILTAIRNSAGPRPSFFVPEMAFDLLVKPQIKLLESPSLRCVELVYEELVKICHNCTCTVSNYVDLLDSSVCLTFVSGTTTLSKASCSAYRSGFRTASRTLGPNIRLCPESNRNPSSIYQHQSPDFSVWFCVGGSTSPTNSALKTSASTTST
jgi:replication fork clamp-binding protein CrfC